MTSFLSMKGLTELTHVVGNWSDKRASAVARTTYTHQITAIPDHYFALVSRYYAYDPISKEMIALKENRVIKLKIKILNYLVEKRHWKL